MLLAGLVVLFVVLFILNVIGENQKRKQEEEKMELLRDIKNKEEK